MEDMVVGMAVVEGTDVAAIAAVGVTEAMVAGEVAVGMVVVGMVVVAVAAAATVEVGPLGIGGVGAQGFPVGLLIEHWGCGASFGGHGGVGGGRYGVGKMQQR